MPRPGRGAHREAQLRHRSRDRKTPVSARLGHLVGCRVGGVERRRGGARAQVALYEGAWPMAKVPLLKPRSKILSTGAVVPPAGEILEPFGDILIAPDLTEASIFPLLDSAIALIVRAGGPVTARIISQARSLRVIGRSGVGYESVDIAAATARGIPVVYTPGAGSRAVAEAALTYMLVLCKRLFYWDSQLKAGNWESRNGEHPGDMDGATLGIVSLGSIGQALAQLAQPLRMRMLGFNPYTPPARPQELGVGLVSLETLLRESDFISLHAPLTNETKGLINAERLRSVKRGAYLINLARGGLVESLDVLYQALSSGQLGGVGLDVFSPAPPDVTHPIFQLPNCLTSPHALATTKIAMQNIFRSMAEDMAAVLRGERPRFAVNSEVFGVERS